MRIEFVCTNDVCRGPMTLSVVRTLLARSEDEEMQQVLVDSCGVANYHQGEDPDPRMRKAAATRGYELKHRARVFDPEDVSTVDLIVAMDAQVLNTMRRLLGGDERQLAKVRMLREFESGGPMDAAVPDPYYGTDASFDQVAKLIDDCCGNLAKKLEAREI